MSAGQFEATAEEWAAIRTRAGDVHADVASDGTVRWWSDGTHVAGGRLADALANDDGRLLGAVLKDVVTGPHWLRLLDANGHGRWMAVLSVPRPDGWLVEFRDVRALGPAAGVPDHRGGVADRDQVLNEVTWLLSATPRTGKETAIVTCELTDLGAIDRAHGRLASEEVMEVVIGRISDTLRAGDLVARIAPERLIVILRRVHDLKGAVAVVKRLQEIIAEPIPLEAAEVEQVMSVGVTLISRGESVDSVLERSEGALDLAVHAGPSRVMTSPPL
ncbi:MAG TPA: hypothetical protein DCQ36_14390 [Actinobacteria bacterium]|jgi:diguanylate cyclase (GGDEF)-like protein|nr:hypothetical protein [Actinomycetota bacterium]